MKKGESSAVKKEPMSKIRRSYFLRLIARCLIFIAMIVLYVMKPECFNVLCGNQFFNTFSPLHIVWLIWVVDMVQQLIPAKEHIPLGSQKHFRQRFQPILDKISIQAIKEHAVSTAKSAYMVMLIWFALIAVISALYRFNVISAPIVFLISTAFYVCDLICVLIWCPFRLIMKNRCCTTCRIFNWDHLMMFTPMLFIGSFFSSSLVLLSIIVWAVWEICTILHPERFWEKTNQALQCASCTDKLCTQYCQKLRK